MPPSGVNFTAFLTRFQSTCWSLAGSALTWWSSAGQVEHEFLGLAEDLALANLDGLLDQGVAVGDAPVQRHLALDDPHHVQQVVDQPGLEVDVLADHLQGRADLLGVGRPLQHRGGRQEDRVERRPQLVREDGEEVVLRPVGTLGLGQQAVPLLLVPPPVGDVPGDRQEAVRRPVGAGDRRDDHIPPHRRPRCGGAVPLE